MITVAIGSEQVQVRPILVGKLGEFKEAYDAYAGYFAGGVAAEIDKVSRTLFDVCISNSDIADPDALFATIDTDTLWTLVISVPGEPLRSMIEAGAENIKNISALTRQKA